MNYGVDIKHLGYECARASQDLVLASTSVKNEALSNIANMLRKMKSFIMEVNAKEVQQAQQRALPVAIIDRMTLNDRRYDEMVEGVEQIIALPDPVGRILDGRTLPSGLTIQRRAVPLGVIGVIYESRPNVTIDTAALCLKSGNGVILRGGSECFQTNLTLYELMREAISNSSLNASVVKFISSPERDLVNKLLTLDEYVDVIIPRGGEALYRACVQYATVPVLLGGFGVSHIFVDESADLERAVEVILNAKTQKPAACNSLDTLIVHRECAMSLAKILMPSLSQNEITVHVHGDMADIFRDYPYLAECNPDDFDREFLGLEMNIIMADTVHDAIMHLRRHKAIHSDAILTNDLKNAELFSRAVPSACAYINASTRFTDGGQFGLGAEVAVSTQKLHARGPMGLEALTTYQYVCKGDYLVRP